MIEEYVSKCCGAEAKKEIIFEDSGSAFRVPSEKIVYRCQECWQLCKVIPKPKPGKGGER